MKTNLLAIAVYLLAFAACSTPTGISPLADSDGEIDILTSKQGGGGNTDTDPRARYTFFDVLPDGVTATRITGDHRNALGDPLPTGEGYSVYEGERCGVHGKIFATGSGDAVMDPDFVSLKSTTCGEARFVQFSDDHQSFPNGSFMNVGDLYGVGDPQMPKRFTIGTNGVLGCDRLRFINLTVDSDDVVTYVEHENTGGSRSWEVSSVAPHQAECLITVGNKTVLNPENPTVYAPFYIVVDEIPFVQ